MNKIIMLVLNILTFIEPYNINSISSPFVAFEIEIQVVNSSKNQN